MLDFVRPVGEFVSGAVYQYLYNNGEPARWLLQLLIPGWREQDEQVEQALPDSWAFKAGQTFDDGAAVVQGILEIIGGSSAAGGGGALCVTGFGCIAGAPAIVAAAALQAHGGTIAYEGLANIAKRLGIVFHSSHEGGSESNGSEIRQEIGQIARKYDNLQCVPCAQEIENSLRSKGIRGRRIKLDTPRQTPYDEYIYDDSIPGDAISENGHHEGVSVVIDGVEIVFDNNHPNGVPIEQWFDNLTFDSKERLGARFRESGYSF